MKKKILALITVMALTVSVIPHSLAEDYIKWVDFDVTADAMQASMDLDIASQSDEPKLNWIEMLSYLACKYGGDFSKYKPAHLFELAGKLKNGETMEKLTEGNKYYGYYFEAYSAVLGQFVGKYRIELPDGDDPSKSAWQERYGLKAFSPIAEGFAFSHYDDFGAGRSYGYQRRHLGHDMMCATGTPVVAAESGIVEALGWNKYGGWRIGIRSFDGLRYYYYAHLRKNKPFHVSLTEGSQVQAGDVIGYVGRNDSSATENTNGIKQSHLHFGMQLIFDESQKEGPKEIWIDAYAIIRLLDKNRSSVIRDPETKEFYRKYQYEDLRESPEPEGTVQSAGIIESRRLPIIMYHKLSNNKSLLGKYTITPEELEADLVYLKENGYTSVTMSEVLDFVHDKGGLPEKPVMLTFDDGDHSIHRLAYPLLEKHGMKAVLAIIGSITDEYSAMAESDSYYPNMTWRQIKELSDSGLVEVQSHSYDLHKSSAGAKRKPSESGQDYQKRLERDNSIFQKRLSEMTSAAANTFVYPFGARNSESDNALRDLGFQATLSCFEGINEVTPGNEDCLFGMRRNLRPHGGSGIAGALR